MFERNRHRNNYGPAIDRGPHHPNKSVRQSMQARYFNRKANLRVWLYSC